MSKTDLVSDLQSMLASVKTSQAELTSKVTESTESVEALETKLTAANKMCTELQSQMTQVKMESETSLACLKDQHDAELRDLRFEEEF